MADDTNIPTTEDLKILQEYKDLIKDTKADWDTISTKIKESHARVNKLLDTQADYATANDKHLVFLEEMKRIELERLANEKEGLNEVEKKLRLRLQELAAAKNLSDEEKKEVIALKKQIKTRKDNLKVLEAENRARDKEIAQKQKIQKLEENAEKLTDNALQQSTGMVTSAGSLGELIAKNAAEGKGFGDIMEGVSKSFGKTFTKANLLMTVVGKLREMGESFKSTFIGIDTELMDFAQTARIFTRETGAADKFGKELYSLKSEFHDLNFLYAETSQAYQGMLEHSTAFMHHSMGSDQRKELALQAATLERFNVSTSTFAETVDSLNKTFGESPAQIKRTTSGLTKFARALGVGPDKMLNQFNENLSLMAQYGRDKGVKVFKELSVAAQHAGVELKSLVSIAKTFDTFEGAAEAAGKLNFILGGPLINSIDMINQSENERIQTLKDSLQQSGKTFAAMGRYEKQLIAQVLQTDIATAQKLFSSDDINNIEAATRAVQDNANGARNLAAEADDLRTLKERDRLATEAQIEATKFLAAEYLKFNEMLLDFKKFMAPVMAGLGAISALFGEALPYVIGLFGAKILSVLGVGGLLSKGLSLFTGKAGTATRAFSGFLGRGGVLAKLSTGFGTFFTATSRGFSGLITSAGRLASGLVGGGGLLAKLGGVGASLKAGAMTLFSGAGAALAGAAAAGGLIGHKINEMSYGEGNVDYGSMADLRGMGRAIGFADGVTRFGGGTAVVGERGPELVNLPRGSNVITNENLNRLILALEKQATSASGTKAEDKQTLNITLELDGDVLARHTRKISFDTMTQALSVSPGQ